MQPKIFAIVINWNGEKDTIVCLDSLLKLNYDNCHVIISDNGSRPESLEAVKNWLETSAAQFGGSGGIASGVLIENGKNLGFTGANTVGVNHALGRGADYVLFLNNDTIVTPDFLAKMVSAGESSPEVGIIGCKIFYTDVETNGRHKLWSLGGYTLCKGMPINIASGQYDRPEWSGVKSQSLINGCCMLIKRTVIEAVGVQDDELFFGIDDVEFSFRASKNGWKNIIACDASIYHSASQSVTPHSGLQVYYLFRNVLLFRSRYFPVFRNLPFYTYFLFRYLLLGCTYRFLRGRNRVNTGVFLAIGDFVRGRFGECPHRSLVPNKGPDA